MPGCCPQSQPLPSIAQGPKEPGASYVQPALVVSLSVKQVSSRLEGKLPDHHKPVEETDGESVNLGSELRATVEFGLQP